MIKSFKHAWRGLAEAYSAERNFRFELLIGAGVLTMSLIFPLTGLERLIIILVVAIVLVLELLNSALERMIDTLSPRIDVSARVVKDILAAAVLLMSMAGAVVGVIIFYPYIRDFLDSSY